MRFIWILGLCWVIACGSGDDDGGGQAGDAAAGGDAAGDASGVIASECPANEFATGVGGDGALDCAPIDAAAMAAVNEHCSIYLGWQDGCDGCTTDPTKWGRASGASCENGAGTDNTCTSESLGGVDVELFGLNTDDDVDDDDKLHVGWDCALPDDEPVPGPCAEGAFLSSIGAAGGEGDCVTASAAIAGYARSSCDVYLGWNGDCDGCTTSPAKWGRVNGDSCSAELGLDDTCTTATLGDETVRLFGLNTDDDVDGNDKIHLGLHCAGAATDDGVVDGACPDGQLVVAVEADGRVRCASPVPAAQAAIRSSCHLYLGWRDACDGCTEPPTKWGRVGHADCENGAGADDTCSAPTLGDVDVQLFGLSPDNDVDDDDKLYVGLKCVAP